MKTGQLNDIETEGSMNNTTPDRSSPKAATRFTRPLFVTLTLLMGIGVSLGGEAQKQHELKNE